MHNDIDTSQFYSTTYCDVFNWNECELVLTFTAQVFLREMVLSDKFQVPKSLTHLQKVIKEEAEKII